MVRPSVLARCATAAILVAACGGGASPAASPSVAPTATAAASKETSAQAMTRLYELAKAEGTVAIYSSMNNDDAKKVFPLFEQKFPGLKVQHTRASGEDLVTKVVTGKNAVEQGDVVVYSALRKILGDAEAQATLKYIAANKPSLRSGHTEMANLLAAGEFAATLSSNGHRLAQLKYEDKKTIDWARTDPIITDVQAMSLADKPPHPNAGKLLMEWLTPDEGQMAIP